MKLTIGKKLAMSFGAVVVMMGGLVASNYVQLRSLSAAQDEGAARSQDAIRAAMAGNIGATLYRIIADSIINGDLEQSDALWTETKRASEELFGSVNADTDMEREAAKKAELAYDQLVYVYEAQMLPLLREGITDPGSVAALDALIDDSVQTIQDEMGRIKESLDAEQVEADKVFDAMISRIIAVSFTVAFLSC